MSGMVREKATTLADYLRSLVAGDPCPCCAGPLQSGSTRSAELTCAACGCEIDTEQWPVRMGAAEEKRIAA